MVPIAETDVEMLCVELSTVTAAQSLEDAINQMTQSISDDPPMVRREGSAADLQQTAEVSEFSTRTHLNTWPVPVLCASENMCRNKFSYKSALEASLPTLMRVVGALVSLCIFCQKIYVKFWNTYRNTYATLVWFYECFCIMIQCTLLLKWEQVWRINGSHVSLIKCT